MIHKKYIAALLVLVLLLALNISCSLNFFSKSQGNDWPMWRYDASRSASSPHKLSDKLRLQWVRIYPKLEQAWKTFPNRDLMQFDRVYEPVVLGKTLFVGSSASDNMVALDTETGKKKWSFYVDGPVRLPPVAHNGKVYFVSDDGYLYCVDAEGGELVWKFQGGPADRKILGNERMISTWPARGGPVVEDGIIYFGAGIWPFMGIFIYALDAETGEVIWENDSTGPIYIKQPHDSPAYSGVAPQGAFVASGDKLLIPCGRSIPACFDRQTGELLYYHLAENNKNGGAFVSAQGDYFVNHHGSDVSLYDLAKGNRIISQFGDVPVMTEKTLFSMGGRLLFSMELKFQQDLDDRLFSVGLQQQFERNSGPLSKNVTIQVLEKSRKWIVSDEDRDVRYTIMKENGSLNIYGRSITAFDLGNLRQEEQEERLVVDAGDRKVKIVRDKEWVLDERWKYKVDASGDLIKAGNRLYAGGEDVVSAVSIPRFGTKPKVKWQANIEGTVARLIAADDKLFVVTLEGRIYAFGRGKVKPEVYPNTRKKSTLTKTVVAKAKDILKTTGVKEGYCLAYGLKSGDLVEALVRNSDLRIIAVEPDPEKVASLRKRYIAMGLYGDRLTVLTGDPFEFEAPPYVASLMVFEDLEAAGYKKGDVFFKRIYNSIRPYGGVACLPVSGDEMTVVAQQIQRADLPGAKVRKLKKATKSLQLKGHILLIRSGALPGAADWTHQYGDIARTAKSDDQLVKLPLGVLWFGGSSNMDVLPRHGHGPPEQIVDGRLIIEGVDGFSARDVYTGRPLWKRSLSNLNTSDIYHEEANGPKYDSDQKHLPGTNARDGNFVVTPDRIYVAKKNSCVILNPATGDIIEEIRIPQNPKTDMTPEWGYIGVYKDYLIAGWGFARYSDFIELDEYDTDIEAKKIPFHIFDKTSSKKLVVMNRYTGEVLWTRDSSLGFRHSGITVGNDKIFCIDRVPPLISATLRRRTGKYPLDTPKLMALNLSDGSLVWSVTKNVFGTWLSYSEEYDTLLQARMAPDKDKMEGEPGKKMMAHKGKRGTVLWNKDVDYDGVCILHHDTIITNKYAYNLLTGKRKTRMNPLTGKESAWAYQRNYGCNYAIASEYMLTFRSAAAGFFDLMNDGGTGNFGGFKSGCTANLIAANGVLNAPDYTRTCSCSYQNQTSLALIHTPDVEIWTDYPDQRDARAIASSTSAIAFTDMEGKLTFVNKSFLKMLGYENDSKVLGKSALEFLQDGTKVREAMATLLDKGEWAGELTAVKKSGLTRDIYLSASVSKDAAEVPVSIMASFVNITKSAIALFDLEGKLTYVNDAFLNLLEYDESEVLGRPITKFWRPREKVLEVQAALRKKGRWKGELTAVKEDGTTVEIYLSAGMAADETGSNVAATASFVDLSERKKLKSAVDSLDSALRASRNIKQLIEDDKPVKSVGINLGAPGDRRADNGTLWLEYPIVGGPSPSVPVTIHQNEMLFKVFNYNFHAALNKGNIPARLRRLLEKQKVSLPQYAAVSVQKKGHKWLIEASRKRTYIVEKEGYWLNVYLYEPFSHHSSRIQGEGLKWVAASGIKGVSSVTVALARRPTAATNGNKTDDLVEAFIEERPYTVRLYFSEPDDVEPGQRVFDIAIQGQNVLKEFDIVAESDGKNRPVVKEFSASVTWDLKVSFTPSGNATEAPLICGIEVMPEGW